MNAAPARPQVNRWIPAIAVMLSAVMEVLDTSVVNVSLPHISGSLSATVDQATWVLTSYVVANAIILPISGWLASYFGRRRLLMIVVTGFTLSSVACGLAPSLGWLIFLRIMQGTTGGGLQPLSQAVLLEGFPVEERGKAMAVWGMGIVAAPILGPLVGGWLTENYSWRWVFYINLPIGLASLIMIYLFVYDPPYLARTSSRIDVWGLGLLVLGIGSLQIMLDKGQQEDWFGSHFIITLFVLAVVGLTVFVVHELMTKEPIVDLRLLGYGTFSAGVFVGAILGFVLYGSLILLPLFMQELLGFPAQTAGFWSSPRGLGTMLFMPLTGYLLGRRWDPRILLAVGLAVAGYAFFMYSHLNLQAGAYDLLWPQLIQGAGMSLVFVPLTTVTMDPIPLRSMGFATSIFSLVRNIGSSMGISFVTTELARRSQMHQNRLVESINIYNPALRQGMESLGGAVQGTTKELGMLYGQIQQQASLMSFLDLYYVLGIMFLAAIPVCWLMRKPEHQRAGAAAVH